MAVILAVLVILYSFQSLFCRLYSSSRDGKGAIQFAVCYSAFVGICTLAVNGFTYKPSWTTVLLGLINAVMILLYNVSMVKASNLGSYAFMMICSLSGGILVPMVYDAAYLHSSFSALRLCAVGMMLVSFVIMNLDGVRGKKSGRYLVWVLILFLVNGLYGVFMNLQQTLMDFTQRSEMITTTFLGMAIFTAAFEFIAAPKAFVGGFRMSAKSAAFMAGSSICATVAVNMLLYAMQKVNLTVLNVVNNGGVLAVSALFAFLLFKEKPTFRTVVGILLACASIVILSL